MKYTKLYTYVAFIFAVVVLVSPMVSFAEQSDVDPLGDTVSCANISHSLRYGMRDAADSNDISVLQDFLNSNGYLSSAASGFFGKATLQAVKTFQIRNGLTSTGYVGSLTIAKIHDLDCTATNNTNDNNQKKEVVITDNHNMYCTMLPVTNNGVNANQLVRVLSPNGGEKFVIASGDKVTITWGTCGIAPYAPVDISITNGTNTYSLTNGYKIGNNGSFTYTVPEIPARTQGLYSYYNNHFKVVVSVCPVSETLVADTHPQLPCVSDASDGEFSIVPQPIPNGLVAPIVATKTISYGSGDNGAPGVFVANGAVVSNGSSPVVAEYIKYGTTPGSGTTGAIANVVMGGEFIAQFPGQCMQPIYYEAYAVNASNLVGHGDEVYGANVFCGGISQDPNYPDISISDLVARNQNTSCGATLPDEGKQYRVSGYVSPAESQHIGKLKEVFSQFGGMNSFYFPLNETNLSNSKQIGINVTSNIKSMLFLLNNPSKDWAHIYVKGTVTGIESRPVGGSNSCFRIMRFTTNGNISAPEDLRG